MVPLHKKTRKNHTEIAASGDDSQSCMHELNLPQKPISIRSSIGDLYSLLLRVPICLLNLRADWPLPNRRRLYNLNRVDECIWRTLEYYITLLQYQINTCHIKPSLKPFPQSYYDFGLNLPIMSISRI